MRLTDPLGRNFSYLRLSLTPICNFRCQYCLPHGNPADQRFRDPLLKIEIIRLVRAFVEMGLTKVRLTGGEPTTRPDFIDIVRELCSIPGLETLALTTNGYRLDDEVEAYRAAGISHLNVSIDSLDSENFQRITGADKLISILSGVHKARALSFRQLKINAVMLKGLNDHEFLSFVQWVSETGLTVRFIELMPTGDTVLFHKKHHCDLEPFQRSLEEMGWQPEPRPHNGGPSNTFAPPQGPGKIGFIRPSTNHFCDSCNRLRVSFQGELQMCLFGTGRVSLRHYLQRDSDKEALQTEVAALLTHKQASHHLKDGDYGITRNLASIGG